MNLDHYSSRNLLRESFATKPAGKIIFVPSVPCVPANIVLGNIVPFVPFMKCVLFMPAYLNTCQQYN